jgi:hypothetical protein
MADSRETMAPFRKDKSPDFRKTSATLVALLVVSTAAFALLAPTAQAAAPYKPPEMTNQAVQDATLSVALEYANAVPGLDAKTLRWFLYAVEHRESTFNVNHCNYNDGVESWASPRASFWPTSDHYPHGCGLTQLTGWRHAGMPYPNNAASPPSTLDKGIYGMVAPPRTVTSLSNPFDAKQNLRRFVTEEVLPDFVAIHKTYPSYSTAQVLRAVAFHWNKGEYTKYNPNNCDYLCGYDARVAVYKAAVLADHAWPSGGSSPAPQVTPPSTTSGITITVSPNVNHYWIEAKVSPSASSVTASVNGGTAVPLKATSWGAWAASTYVPSGARVVLTAKVGSSTATVAKTWT